MADLFRPLGVESKRWPISPAWRPCKKWRYVRRKCRAQSGRVRPAIAVLGVGRRQRVDGRCPGGRARRPFRPLCRRGPHGRGQQPPYLALGETPLDKRRPDSSAISPWPTRKGGPGPERGCMPRADTLQPRGKKRFGYDPLFEIVEYHRSFAELGHQVKACLSHRARAPTS